MRRIYSLNWDRCAGWVGIVIDPDATQYRWAIGRPYRPAHDIGLSQVLILTDYSKETRKHG